MTKELAGFNDLQTFKDHPVNEKLDEVFQSVIQQKKTKAVPMSSPVTKASSANEVDELVLDELEIDLGLDDSPMEVTQAEDDGLDLNFSDEAGLELGGDEPVADQEADSFGDLSLDDQNLGELDFGDLPQDGANDLVGDDEGLTLTESETVVRSNILDQGDDHSLDELSSDDSASAVMSLDDTAIKSLSLDASDNLSIEGDLSEDAKEKLKEIDAIMDHDLSQVNLQASHILENVDENLDQPLVSDDLDLDSLNFGNEEAETVVEIPVQKEDKSKKKKKDIPSDHGYGQELKEISGAYSGEMERMQATISNLRSDRDELLARIDKLEEGKTLQSRQSLSLRAELDEKKIELTIMRKKLNEEITDLRDRLKFFDEKKLILEEKNKVLLQELDKASQKNKIDVKKVQLREKELEQKLELLKSDAESQIRHRDLKILELKRKLDAMEFDMESISTQEKRSVESRYELEDKLEKAIKTLRGAITVLEDEPDRTNALNALKKNIDM